MIRRSDMPLTRAGSHPRGLTLYGITALLRSKEIACPDCGRRSCLGLERRWRAQRFATPGVKRVVDHQAMTQGHDRAAGGQLPRPAVDFSRSMTDRAND